METVLVVDDDPGFGKLLATILRGQQHEVVVASSVDEALAEAGRRSFDLVLCDLKLRDGEGIAVLRWFHERAPETPVIMITAFGTVASAVEAMKLGAVDYIGKPLGSPEELRLLVRRTLDQSRIASERELLREEQQRAFNCGSLIGQDLSFTRVLQMAAKVAPTNATVLVLGESGTGKELLARCIHANSPRAGRAFVAVNCAALSPTLIESELFGHEKGSFTGAVAQHQGRFERAHGGTLFLDEIGELDGNLQAKLLRVLQERTFERLGGMRQITVDVRVIAATNRDLKEMVREGKFRQDLYYRVSTFPLEVPALRERRGDIMPLARFFLAQSARSLGKKQAGLSPEAETALLAYDWPGNVRELQNVIERAAILSDDTVSIRDLPLPARQAASPLSWREIERKAIEDALHMHRGNRAKAAKQLGISLRTLQYRLKEYGTAE